MSSVVLAPPARMEDLYRLSSLSAQVVPILPDRGYAGGRRIRRGLRAGPAEDRSRIPGAMIVFSACPSGVTGPPSASNRSPDSAEVKSGDGSASTSLDVGEPKVAQPDFVQFWIDKIAGVAVCGSNPINGGLSEITTFRMSRPFQISRAFRAAELQFVMSSSSSRGGGLSEVCSLAPASHLPVQPSREQEMRTRPRPAFLGKDPARSAGRKRAHPRSCVGHCHCGTCLGVPGTNSDPEITRHQTRE